MDNPIGYLYRVGRSRTRGRRYRVVFARADGGDQWFEPRLGDARRRSPNASGSRSGSCTGTGGRCARSADVCGLRVTTVQNHLERGTARLRALLGVSEDV